MSHLQRNCFLVRERKPKQRCGDTCKNDFGYPECGFSHKQENANKGKVNKIPDKKSSDVTFATNFG